MNNNNVVQPDNPQAKALAESQKPRITDADCEILSIFKGAEELVFVFKNLLLGFEMTDKDRYIIEDRLDNDEVKRVIRKFLLPELGPEIPLGQNIDLWMTNDIASSDKENFELNYKVKKLMIGMIETSLARLDDPSKEGVDLSPKKDLAFLKARIGYINHVTTVLQDIIMSAHRSSESSDDTSKNSSK